ncbi:MAG: hypothetical protein NTZ05_20500 [Chloroflexi bacterium]|nr:hypothetical protein [Chloroflexota bacterium]
MADQLFISPYLTIAMARDILEVSFPAAQSNVQKLVEAGILRSGGDSPRGRLFVADEVLWVVGEQAPAGHH